MDDRFSFDVLSKDLFERFYAPYGRVVLQAEVHAPAQFIDALVDLSPDANSPPGLLGRMVVPGIPTLFEPFSKTPSLASYRACERKQLTFEHNQSREACPNPRPVIPRLYVLSPGRPRTVLSHEKMSPFEGFPSGFYVSPNGTVFVVVISELPKTRDTLLLRLLGRGTVLDEALAELAALPPDAWEHRVALAPLVDSGLVKRQNHNVNDHQKANNMTGLYHIWEQQVLDQGRMQGIQLGLEQGLERGLEQGLERGLERGRLVEARAALQRVLARRELPVSKANLARIETCTDLATLERWHDQAIVAKNIRQALQ